MIDREPLPLVQSEPWMADAACRGMDPNIFHPERGESVGQIRRICAGCPVAAQCLDYALRLNVKVGFYGGKSERERRAMRSRRRGGHQRPIDHGTNAGYEAHKRRDEHACPSCIDAHRRYVQAIRRSRAGSAA